ncbi:MAG: endonuclease V [Saprospiraceae bacterium]
MIKTRYIPFGDQSTGELEASDIVNIDQFDGVKVMSSDEGDCYKSIILKGKANGMWTNKAKGRSMLACLSDGFPNGYYLFEHSNGFGFRTYDMGHYIERVSIDLSGKRKDIWTLNLVQGDLSVDALMAKHPDTYKYVKARFEEQSWGDVMDIIDLNLPQGMEVETVRKITWAIERKQRETDGLYKDENDFLPYYLLQETLRKRVVSEDQLPRKLKFIAGVDVAYSEVEQRMVGAISVLDAETMEVVDSAWHEMAIAFPYVPILFSFREVTPILEAFKKLKIKPDLVVCDGHGIAHPKNMGLATHLGIELDIPTIGCAKNRLVGVYNKSILGKERGKAQPLIWDSKEVGVALRTQYDTNPVFVSIGHKISLRTAVMWVLHLASKFRFPETTNQANLIVNQLIKRRSEFDFWGDDG